MTNQALHVARTGLDAQNRRMRIAVGELHVVTRIVFDLRCLDRSERRQGGQC